MSLAFSKLDPFSVIAAAISYFLILLLNAWRCEIISQGDDAGRAANFSNFFRAHCAGMVLSDVTPGRVGYAYFAVAMRRFGMRAAQSAKILGVNVSIDFLVRAICLVFLGLYAPAVLGANMAAGLSLAFFTVISIATLGVGSRRVSSFLGSIPFFGRKARSAYDSAHSTETSFGRLLASFSGSVAGTFLRGIEWLLVFNCAASVPLTFHNLLVFSALVAVVTGLSFIPVSIAGIGVQEGVGAALFAALFSVQFSAAAALMLVCRAVELAVDSLGLVWLKL
jgi:hypothetical protein